MLMWVIIKQSPFLESFILEQLPPFQQAWESLLGRGFVDRMRWKLAADRR